MAQMSQKALAGRLDLIAYPLEVIAAAEVGISDLAFILLARREVDQKAEMTAEVFRRQRFQGLKVVAIHTEDVVVAVKVVASNRSRVLMGYIHAALLRLTDGPRIGRLAYVIVTDAAGIDLDLIPQSVTLQAVMHQTLRHGGAADIAKAYKQYSNQTVGFSMSRRTRSRSSAVSTPAG